jgi:hypothetical protein
MWPISLICTLCEYTRKINGVSGKLTHIIQPFFIMKSLGKECFGRFGTHYGYFHYFLWEKQSWLTTNLSYDQLSRTNWARKSRVHCIPEDLLWAKVQENRPTLFSIHTYFPTVWRRILLHCKQTKGHVNKCCFQRFLGPRNNVLIWEVFLKRRNWKNFGAVRQADFQFQPLISLGQIRSMWDVTSPGLLWVVALSFCLTTLPSRIIPRGDLSPRHLYLS